MTTATLALRGKTGRARLSWDRDGLDWPNREVSRFVDAGGVRWHVQRAGSGPELLLLHGTGASTHSWRDLLPLLAQHFTVTALDLPGHGFTGTPADGDLSIEAMAARVADLLRALDVQPACCVGHSAGAVIGVEMILDGLIEPDLMVGLNGAFFPFPGLTGHVFGALARLLAGSSLASAWFARRAADPDTIVRLLRSTGSTLDDDSVARYQRLYADRGHVRATLGMMAHWDLHRLQARLWELETPVLLIVGEQDQMVPPRDAERVRERVAACEITREPGLGHLAHEEAPERIVAAVLEPAGRSLQGGQGSHQDA